MKHNPRDFVIKPSTQRFIREAKKIPGYSLYDLLHGYIYARWPYLYIGIGTGEHPVSKIYQTISYVLKRLLRKPANGKHYELQSESDTEKSLARTTIAENYHGKVVTLEAASRLVTVREDIDLPNLEQVIPFSQARDIVLRNPDHIVTLECPCRVSRSNPCLPLDVCLIIGEPFAGFVMEHHPERARWISPTKAVEILQAEDARGHVHHAFFKDAMLGRFYAICNCCSCCCGAMQAQRNGTPMLLSSGYVLQVDEDQCVGCGDCVEFCQFGALSLIDGYAKVDKTICMGCGVCNDKCAQGALSLKRDISKGEPLEICELVASAGKTVPIT